MSKHSIIYKASFPNGKSYIGVTCRSLSKRKVEHISKVRSGSKLYFHNALRLHKDAVIWEVLAETSSYEEALVLERKFIKEFDSIKNGYNLTEGGEGTAGLKFSEQQLRRLSESHKGYKMPESQKAAIGLANSGKRKSYAKSVKRTDIITGEIKLYESFQDIVKEQAFDRVTVYKVIQGKRKQHKGYFWEFVR